MAKIIVGSASDVLEVLECYKKADEPAMSNKTVSMIF